MPVIVEQRVLQRAVAAAAPIDNAALKFYCRRRLVQPEEQHHAQLGSCSLSACCRTPQKHSELLILKGFAPQVAAAANEVGVEIEVVAVAGEVENVAGAVAGEIEIVGVAGGVKIEVVVAAVAVAG